MSKNYKNYVGFINDHSGSMQELAKAALTDYNATIGAFKDAASREMLDTIVNVIGIGAAGGSTVVRQVVNSNPHVLKPMASWPTPGGTPLYDGIADMIRLMQSLPDWQEQHVSFLITITTDGEECSSRFENVHSIKQKIEALDNRFTIVMRVPKGYARQLPNIGIPAGNIVEWETTEKGMREATAVTKTAVDDYYKTRALGVSGSTVFYANAAGIDKADLKAMKNISAEVKLWVVPQADNGAEIKPFCEKMIGYGKQFLKGAAFYQLTKTEARVQDTKLILIRDRLSGHVYQGAEARAKIGLSTVGTVRLHPGNHGNFDIFIQSTSINRKLVAGTGVIYWEAVGTAFTAADLEYLNRTPAAAPVAPAAQPTGPGVTVLAAVTPTNKPTKSPLVPAPANQPAYFETREMARQAARKLGKSLKDNGPNVINGKRWSIA